MGKNGGAENLSGSGTLKYCFARAPSNVPMVALAGSVHGGLLPDPTLMPPRKMGCMEIVMWCLAS